MMNAGQESFEVYSGSILLYDASGFTNGETRTIEQCLTATSNNQYSLMLLNSFGNSWYSGSHLTIYGKYGNIVFKNFLSDSSYEAYTFSLYYGIEQNASWKMTSGSITAGWTAYSFSDSTWTDVELGSVTTSVSGAQYFRKQFVGLSSMAAYDVRLNYKAGVIAYINGAEVYRDNMPAGDVTASTAATDEYDDVAYRGFIRPGSEVASQQSILAVEVHFVNSQTTVDFNAYLAILAASTTEGNCFVYSESTSITATGGTNQANIFDFGRTSYYYANSLNLPTTVLYTFEGPRPYINSVRVWPYTSPSFAPSSFTWQGSNDNSQWANIVSISGASYESSAYKTFFGSFHHSLYSYYRANIASSPSPYVWIYEMQPLICTIAMPTSITFTPNSYTFWAIYDEVYVKPDINEFTSCTAQNLPEGLSIDSTTCVISGITSITVSDYHITVSSVLFGNTYTGSFTLTIQGCIGTLLNVLRTYKSDATKECFEIKDTSSQQVVMSVASNSGQNNNEDWENVVCVIGSKYKVTVDSASTNWQAESHLYVRSVLLNSQMETILRMRYDSYVGFPNYRYFNAQYAISVQSIWYYKHGEIPADWYSSTSTEGWTGAITRDIPDSTNQIQLYKKAFTVSDINNIAGFVISLKYKYGCVIYLNGHEVFRKGITDTIISTSSYADNIYTDTLYHQISLPIKTVQIGDTAAVNYIQQGSNMIAVGIVAANANQKEAIFDCALRLMGEETASRVFDYTISFSTISGNPSSMLSQYYNDIVFYSTCADNYLNIAFNNDRHEWINSVTIKLHYTQFTEVPHQFVLKARNENDGWTALKAVTGLTWSQIGQAQTIYFLNNKAYHEYRFENFATGDSSDCYWKFNTLDLFSMYTTMTIPELAYDDLIIFKDIKMAEVYPNSEYYTNYQTSPALPDGISIDPNTGMIYGTARIEMEVTTYSITATKLTGGTSTASFSLTVESCTGGRSLVTLVVRTDSFPEQSSYRLYEGIGTSGTVVDSIDRFMLASSLNYAYFCLNDGIYTLELLDSSSNGWSNPAGYYLTVDSGEMIFEMGQVPSGVASVTTMFSSYIPFQIEYTDWKIRYNYVEDWNILKFDDSGWLSKKASEIGTNGRITTYIRKEVNIPDISKYHVLNIRVKYAGGVAAYFNGRLVARFNLEEIFDSASKSIAIHNQDTFSKFHVILSTVGGVTGKNIMAFEIHRPLGQFFSSPVIFDATGVFGVNDCSIVVDSYETISSSYPYAGDINELLDLNPTTYGYQPNSPGFCFTWKVENLEGARFNRLGMQTVYTRTNYDFSIFGINKVYTLYYKILQVTDQSTSALERKVWSVPKGTVGFKELRFQLDKAASDTVYLSSYLLLYCKPDGSGICPASGDYPSVGEGEVSLGSCQYGCFGYSYRTCSNGQLGEIKYEYCKQKLPLDLKYNGSKYELVLDINAYIAAPTYTNIIESFYLPSFSYLPDGLQLNKETGEITGVPTETHVSKTFTICGQNQVGTISTTIEISIRKGMCYGDKRFRSVEVGKSCSYDCSRYEPYIGTLSRVCVLGEKDGEWQKTTGICVHVAVVFVIIIVVIILAAVGCTFLTKYRWILKENKRNNTRLTSSLAPSMGPSMTKAIPISDNSSKRIELVPARTNAVENNGLVNTENDIEKVPNNIGTRVIRV